MALKNTIKVQRAIHNLTQAELAERIGVSRQTINAIEANKYVPSTLLALRMAKVFNVSVEDFFQLDEDVNSTKN
ncbi:MAG: helix-turn-helix transcriptional regulator [Saprospiraceae bacterium]|nr:helix-turn-helix transcriptional regulator [Saprospiraceae bacterium]